MKAKFGSGRCNICDRPISAGQDITKRGTWVHEQCAVKEDAAIQVFFKAQKALLEKANIAYGVFGIPEGAQPTWTRAEFWRECEKFEVLTAEELALLKWHWRVVWYRALDD